MERTARRWLAGAIALAGAAMVTLAGEPGSTQQALRQAAVNAHEILWRDFVDPRTSQLYTYLEPRTRRPKLPSPADIAARRPNISGWGTAIENCALDGGAYLAALVDRHAVSGSREHAAEARRIYQGLRLIAAAARRRGFIPRGVLPEGKTHYPESSVDQYTKYVHGLWRYYRSPIPTDSEKAEIRGIVAAMLARLEADRFAILSDTGERMTFGALDALRPSRAERLLAIVLAGADVTGDPHWRAVYERLRPPRLAHCRGKGGEPWVLVQNQLALFLLRHLEEDPKVRSVYEAGSHEVARACLVSWDLSRKMLASRRSNQLAGAFAIVLTEDKALIAQHLDKIRASVLALDATSLSIGQFRTTECIVWSLARQGIVSAQ